MDKAPGVHDGAARRRVLMLAPEPVLQPRGTPMSVYHRLRALSALGYAVDLITYPLGEPISVPGVRVIRVWRPWGLKRIPIGPSAAKVPLDALMAIVALGCLLRRRYAALHSHEEAVFIAAVYARLFRLPHLYDMHSSLPQQLSNWRKRYARPLSRLANGLERWAIRRSKVVITICPALAEYLRMLSPTKAQVMIENVATLDGDQTAEEAERVRRRHRIDGAPLIVYTGNFEPYQGIELLVESFARVRRALPAARLLMVVGTREDIARCRTQLREVPLRDAIRFAGSVAPEVIGGYLAAADVLVSPRVSGTNTPLKLYAYLKAGRPVVATDLPTHTQVLSPDVALLAKPDPEAFAQALQRVLTDAELAARLGREARALALARFSDEVYNARVAEAYRLLLEGQH